MVDIVIVNWNSRHYLKCCIDSLVDRAIRNIVVVDNASTDGSEKFIRERKGITLIESKINLGFGKACNLGARHVNSEFILFLNPDACIYSDTINKVLAFMQDPANAQTGICGVQLIGENDHIARHCSRFPTLFGFISHSIGLDRISPRLGHVMAEWDHLTTRNVDQVIGAFFLVRRRLFDALDGFDERFFVYYEEVDFSYRAYCAGWKTTYFVGARAFHAGNGTTRDIKARRLFYSLRSRLVYVSKHFVWYKAFAVYLVSFLIEPFSRSSLSLIRCSWSGFKEIWLAYNMLYRWLLKLIMNYKLR